MSIVSFHIKFSIIFLGSRVCFSYSVCLYFLVSFFLLSVMSFWCYFFYHYLGFLVCYFFLVLFVYVFSFHIFPLLSTGPKVFFIFPPPLSLLSAHIPSNMFSFQPRSCILFILLFLACCWPSEYFYPFLPMVFVSIFMSVCFYCLYLFSLPVCLSPVCRYSISYGLCVLLLCRCIFILSLYVCLLCHHFSILLCLTVSAFLSPIIASLIRSVLLWICCSHFLLLWNLWPSFHLVMSVCISRYCILYRPFYSLINDGSYVMYMDKETAPVLSQSVNQQISL